MLTLDAVVPGDSTITVTATDTHGASVSTTFEVRVNALPTVANPLADVVVTVGTPRTIDVSNTFSDPDPEDTLDDQRVVCEYRSCDSRVRCCNKPVNDHGSRTG